MVLKFLINTVTGGLTALNGNKTEDEKIEPEKDVTSGEVYVPTRFNKEDLPAMVDLREFMTEVENQAAANSCTANAVVGAFEYIMARSGQKVDFSRLFVYYNARWVANTLRARQAANAAAEKGEEFDLNDESLYVISDDGSSICLALCALEAWGVCKEETWDYEV
jgi:hypothetical protein